MRTNLSSTAYIIDELGRRGLHGVNYHTGGGCTAVEIEVPYTTVDGEGETGLVVITDVTGTTTSVNAEYGDFLGWVAGFYASEDGFYGGDEAEWIHAEAYDREALINDARKRGDVAHSVTLSESLRVDWQDDATAMVEAVARFVEAKK